MTLKSTCFKLFAEIIGENYVFCCSVRISFNPTSHLKELFFKIIGCISSSFRIKDDVLYEVSFLTETIANYDSEEGIYLCYATSV